MRWKPSSTTAWAAVPARSPAAGRKPRAGSSPCSTAPTCSRCPAPGAGRRPRPWRRTAWPWRSTTTGFWQFLRQALGQALDGGGESLLLLGDLYNHRGPGGRYTTNASEAIYAVNCLDRPERSTLDTFRADAAEVARLSPIFGAFIVWSNLPCATWPAPAEGAPEPVAATGAAPILVVGTTRDPATPYESAQGLARQLDSGRLLTYDGDGHTAYRQGSGCIDKAVDAYLLEGTVPAAGTRCD